MPISRWMVLGFALAAAGYAGCDPPERPGEAGTIVIVLYGTATGRVTSRHDVGDEYEIAGEISCPPDCSQTYLFPHYLIPYPYLVLRAEAAPGSVFVEWARSSPGCQETRPGEDVEVVSFVRGVT